jgi:hypothetical protein
MKCQLLPHLDEALYGEIFMPILGKLLRSCVLIWSLSRSVMDLEVDT